MLPKENRLKKKKDFERVFQEGKTFSFPGSKVYLRLAPNNSEFSRFGFIVSKKVSNLANVRNRVKRLMRESFRQEIKKIKKGFDGVVVYSPPFKEASLAETKENILKILKKASLI